MSVAVPRSGPRIVWRAREDPAARPSLTTTRQREILVSIFSPVLVLLVWELLVRTALLDGRFFQAPTSIVGTLWTTIRSGELADAVKVSLTRIFDGFLIDVLPVYMLGFVFVLLRS